MKRPSQQAALYEAWIERDGQPPLRIFGNRPPAEAGADMLADAYRRRRIPHKSQLSQHRLQAALAATGAA